MISFMRCGSAFAVPKDYAFSALDESVSVVDALWMTKKQLRMVMSALGSRPKRMSEAAIAQRRNAAKCSAAKRTKHAKEV